MMNKDGAQAGTDFFAGRALYSISAHRPFLTDLAHALHHVLVQTNTAQKSAFALSDAVIYLPTRRAARSLRSAFSSLAGEGAILLPVIKTLGDPDDDEIIAYSASPLDEAALAPAMSVLERQIELTRLIIARDRAFRGHDYWPSAFSGAGELASLLDELYTYHVPVSKVKDAAPPALAAHWEQSLAFLDIVIRAWPAHLNSVGKIDAGDRRNRLMGLQIERWRNQPPNHPVIIAGTTGSTPIVAQMLREVLALPFGAVVLPGLDVQTDDYAWDNIDDTHPQSGLKSLLSRLEAVRDDVRLLDQTSPVQNALRHQTISMALRPAKATDSWRAWAEQAKKDPEELAAAFQDLSLVEASDDEEEAGAIALKIRETFETPGKRVALVTPDRNLGRRVAAKLRRWNIEVDDSAGVAFGQTPCGVYLRLVADWLSNQQSYVALFTLMRHELFRGGLSSSQALAATDELDARARGRHSPLSGGAIDALYAALSRDGDSGDALNLAERLCEAGQSLRNVNSFASYVETVIEIGEQLAGDGEDDGADLLWRGVDGVAGAEHLVDVLGVAAGIDIARAQDFGGAFERLLFSKTVRTPAVETRVAILGPLEARLQHFDLMVIGSLNEGVWPREAHADPFLSIAMRERIGLPSAEKRIGLAAHDFAQFSASPSVMLTRARRSNAKPTKASRWVVRLKNILNGAGVFTSVDKSAEFAQLYARWNAPPDGRDGASEKIAAPTPRPPVEARPKVFFVTHIEKLLRDPYSIYARNILRLKKLDPLDAAFDRRHLGSLIHDVFEKSTFAQTENGEEISSSDLQGLFLKLADQYGMNDLHRAFWRDSISEMLDWFARWASERHAAGIAAVLEDIGTLIFQVDGEDFTIKAKADRIDKLNSGGAYLIDYKTGEVPSKKMTKTFSPQLALTGLIVREGGYEALGRVVPEALEYLRVLNRKGSGDSVISEGTDCDTSIENAFAGLVALMRHYNNPQTPYLSQPHPQYLNRFGDYDKLARRLERRLSGDDE